jgi:DNA-binding HxlR family transcriptional regulator
MAPGEDNANGNGSAAASRCRLPALDLTVGELLRLLATGATASILIALGRGPLRTKRLTAEVGGCTARTVYRHAARLTELGIIEKVEKPGVPSMVVYRLADPAGRALFHLLGTYGMGLEPAWASGDGLRSGLRLIAELWNSGLIAELSRCPRSPTELSVGPGALTFHQINRRTQLFEAGGLLVERAGRGRSRQYGLTRRARRATGLVVGIARWRQRYGADPESPLSVAEMATVLQVALPLIELPGRQGTILKLGVAGPPREGRLADGETLLMTVGEDGVLRRADDARLRGDAWALATLNTWLGAILDGRRSRMRMGGDVEFLECTLNGLHRALVGFAGPAPGPVLQYPGGP